MNKINFFIIIFLALFNLFNVAYAMNYCWYDIKNINAKLEFPCSYEKYDLTWDGKIQNSTHGKVAHGNGNFTLVRKNDGYQTGKIPATFNLGRLKSNISITKDFRRCINKSCDSVEYKVAGKESIFKGEVKYDDKYRSQITHLKKGVLFVGNSLYYHGHFKNNAANGDGYACIGNSPFYNKNIQEMYHDNTCPLPSAYLDGKFKNGKFHKGYAQFVNSDGSFYRGNINNCELEGFGKYRWPDGSSYEGNFARNVRSGIGFYKYSDGSFYLGEWSNNNKNGYGELHVSSNQKFVYKGQFLNGQFNGKGIISFDNGITYVGNFLNNNPHGKGVLVLNGKEIYKSHYVNGDLVNLYKIHQDNFPASFSDFEFISVAHANWLTDKVQAVANKVKHSFNKAKKWVKENSEHIVSAAIGCIAGGAGGALAGGAGGVVGGGIVGSLMPGVGTVTGAAVGGGFGAIEGAFNGCINQAEKAYAYSKRNNAQYGFEEVCNSFKGELSLDNMVWGAVMGAAAAGFAGKMPAKIFMLSKQSTKVLRVLSKIKKFKRIRKIENFVIKKSKKIRSKFSELRKKIVSKYNKQFKKVKKSGSHKKAQGYRATKKEMQIYNKLTSKVEDMHVKIGNKFKKIKTRKSKLIKKTKKNCDLMCKDGKAPFANDGTLIQLHHHAQRDVLARGESYFVEISAREHQDNYKTLHRRAAKSTLESKEFNSQFKKNYWQKRCLDICN